MPGKFDRKVYATIDDETENEIIIVMTREIVVNIHEIARWLEKQGKPGYYLLRTEEVVVIIADRGRKVPASCFPIVAISEDGLKAEHLCARGRIGYTRNPAAVLVSGAIFMLFKKKKRE